MSVADPQPQRQFLFLRGVARSGTTALGSLMNLHSRVAIGVERYKTLAMSAKAQTSFAKDLFTYDRFFAHEEGDTNVKTPPVYESLKPKYHDALYVGDKIPRLYTKLRLLNERLVIPR